jgi:TPR repeat protein
MRAIALVLTLVLGAAGAILLLGSPAWAEGNACYMAAVARKAGAAKLCSAMASQGDPIAQRILGYLYHIGQSVPQDDAQAARWFMQASNQGDAAAQCNGSSRLTSLAGLFSLIPLKLGCRTRR